MVLDPGQSMARTTVFLLDHCSFPLRVKGEQHHFAGGMLPSDHYFLSLQVSVTASHRGWHSTVLFARSVSEHEKNCTMTGPATRDPAGPATCAVKEPNGVVMQLS